ncbi:MAG: lysophospholipid acyltransferase family protein [Proteobacteria bacterium]|nr:lysophospholipid acyltransferase family protein [Pseudomonadota bacterium]
MTIDPAPADPASAAHSAAATPGAAPAPTAAAPAPAHAGRPAWWVRSASLLPLALTYPLARFLAWLTFRFFPYRQRLVQENLKLAFPDFSRARLREVTHQYYLGFAQMLMEIVRGARLAPQELRRRVRIVNLGAPQEHLARGQSVLLVAAHQCNWEWMLLALSLQLGYPLDAAYKPLVNPWAEREMKLLRTRFGSRLVPAQELLADIIRRRKVVRAVAMVADQEPTTSEHKYWTRFLNRDTAFYMGAEEIARVTHFPVFFIGMRRVRRGYYEMDFRPLAAARETLPTGALTQRYAEAVEAQIRAAPPDWPWSHKRWKLRRSLYQKRAGAG